MNNNKRPSERNTRRKSTISLSRKSRVIGKPHPKHERRFRVGWVARLTLVASLIGACFGGYTVYREYWQKNDDASLVIQRIWSGPFEGNPRAILSVAVGVDNRGTETITFRQFNWVLSATPDPNLTVQRRMRWSHNPEEPISAPGGEYTAFEVNISGKSSWLVEGQDFCRYVLSGVPPVVLQTPGFNIQYWSNLVFFFEDSHAQLHEIIIPLGKFYAGKTGARVEESGFFSTYHGPFDPIKVELFPTPVRRSARDRLFFNAPIGSLRPEGTDTTGWRFQVSDCTDMTYQEWKSFTPINLHDK